MPRPTWDELRATVKFGAEAKRVKRELDAVRRHIRDYVCCIAEAPGWTPVAIDPSERTALWKFASAEWQGTCLFSYRIGTEKIKFKFKHNGGFEVEWKQKKSRRMLSNAAKKAVNIHRQSK